jgi:hypothetical protein
MIRSNQPEHSRVTIPPGVHVKAEVRDTRVNSKRVKYYSHKDMIKTEILLDNIRVQDSLDYQPKEILEHRYNIELLDYEVLVHWRGFDMEDNTWELMRNIYIDTPRVLNKYVKKLRGSASKEVKKFLKSL